MASKKQSLLLEVVMLDLVSLYTVQFWDGKKSSLQRGDGGTRTLALLCTGPENYHWATEADTGGEKVLHLFTTYKHTVHKNVFVEKVRATLLR